MLRKEQNFTIIWTKIGTFLSKIRNIHVFKSLGGGAIAHADPPFARPCTTFKCLCLNSIVNEKVQLISALIVMDLQSWLEEAGF